MAIQKTEKIWHNGKLIAWDDATIHVMSHVVHYGSSVFEGVRCYALPSGPAIFRAQEHAQRLLDSAKVYRIDVDYTREEIVAAMCDVIANNNVWPCYLRPIVLRGYGEAGVNPLNSPTEVYVVNYPWGKYLTSDAEGCDVWASVTLSSASPSATTPERTSSIELTAARLRCGGRACDRCASSREGRRWPARRCQAPSPSPSGRPRRPAGCRNHARRRDGLYGF